MNERCNARMHTILSQGEKRLIFKREKFDVYYRSESIFPIVIVDDKTSNIVGQSFEAKVQRFLICS